MDLSKLIGRKQEPQPEENRLSKEEYAALKKAEREELWAKVDNQAQAVFQDDASLKGFLDFMAAGHSGQMYPAEHPESADSLRCTPQSTRNLLILYEQNPEITHPRTFEKWAA